MTLKRKLPSELILKHGVLAVQLNVFFPFFFFIITPNIIALITIYRKMLADKIIAITERGINWKATQNQNIHQTKITEQNKTNLNRWWTITLKTKTIGTNIQNSNKNICKQ